MPKISKKITNIFKMDSKEDLIPINIKQDALDTILTIKRKDDDKIYRLITIIKDKVDILAIYTDGKEILKGKIEDMEIVNPYAMFKIK